MRSMFFLLVSCIATHAAGSQPLPPLRQVALVNAADGTSAVAELVHRGEIDLAAGPLILPLPSAEATAETISLRVQAEQQDTLLGYSVRKISAPDEGNHWLEIAVEGAGQADVRLGYKIPGATRWRRSTVLSLDPVQAGVREVYYLANHTPQPWKGSEPLRVDLWSESAPGELREHLWRGAVSEIAANTTVAIPVGTTIQVDAELFWLDIANVGPRLPRYVRLSNPPSAESRFLPARDDVVVEGVPAIPPSKMKEIITMDALAIGRSSDGGCAACNSVCTHSASTEFVDVGEETTLRFLTDPSDLTDAKVVPWLPIAATETVITVLTARKADVCAENHGHHQRQVALFDSADGQRSFTTNEFVEINAGATVRFPVWTTSCTLLTLNVEQLSADTVAKQLQNLVDNLRMFQHHPSLPALLRRSEAYCEHRQSNGNHDVYVNELLQQLEQMRQGLDDVASANRRLQGLVEMRRENMSAEVDFLEAADPDRFYAEVMYLRRQRERLDEQIVNAEEDLVRLRAAGRAVVMFNN